jgi:hypothetical protein
VPDFTHDPTVASRPASERGSVRLIAREVGVGNIPYSLELEDTPGKSAELSVADTYPQELMLVAVTRQQVGGRPNTRLHPTATWTPLRPRVSRSR